MRNEGNEWHVNKSTQNVGLLIMYYLYYTLPTEAGTAPTSMLSFFLTHYQQVIGVKMPLCLVEVLYHSHLHVSCCFEADLLMVEPTLLSGSSEHIQNH